MKDEPIPPEYYLNGPDEFVNPNEPSSAPEEKKQKTFAEDFREEAAQYSNKIQQRWLIDNNNKLQEENARLRSLIRNAYGSAFIAGYESAVNQTKESAQPSWEQFKKDNNL